MARMLYDLIVLLVFFFLTGVPAVVTGMAVVWLGILSERPWWHFALIGPGAFFFLLLLLIAVAGIRILLPRLKEGEYPFPRHPRAIVWLLHFALQRILYLPLWKYIFFAFSTLRWAFLRALGCRSALDIDTGSDVQILDPLLIEIGSGSMIAAGSILSGHVIENERLILGKISLGKRVQVGGNVLIGPGSSIADHTVIGPECRLARNVSIGEFVHLGAACYMGTQVKIGDNAVLGHHVGIESNVTIGAGAVIRSGALVPNGSMIADGEHYPRQSRKQEA